MDEQKQMTPAPYAAGTGSVPVTPTARHLTAWATASGWR